MQKFILKSNNRFQILNILTDLVDVFRPKILEPVKLRVLTRKKKPCYNAFFERGKNESFTISSTH